MLKRIVILAVAVLFAVGVLAEAGLVGNLRVIISGGERYVTLKDVASVY